jgi:hypothetical protein
MDALGNLSLALSPSEEMMNPSFDAQRLALGLAICFLKNGYLANYSPKSLIFSRLWAFNYSM